MPILDVAAQNASLDNDYGVNHGPGSPDSHDLALFTDHPAYGGVEVTGPGYARVTVAAADWPDADGGAKSVTKTFPDPTDAWTDGAYWVLFDVSTAWDYAPLTEPLNVTGPGAGPLVTITIYHPDTQDLAG